MENFDFDNKIKDGLENINPMLDNDEIWDNIEPHLKKKKKKRLIFWLFFGVLGLLGLLWFQSGNISNDSALSNEDKEQGIYSPPIVQNEINGNETIPQNESVDLKETIPIDNIQELKEEEEEEITIDKKLITKPKTIVRNSAVINNGITSNGKVEQVRTNVNEVKSNIKTTTKTKKETKKETKKDLELEANVGIKNNIISAQIPTNTIKETNIKVEFEDDIEAIESAITLKTIVDLPAKTEIHLENVEESVQTPVLTPNNEPAEEKKLTKEERAEANKKRKKERKKRKEEREKKKKEEREKAEREKKGLTKPNKLPKWKYQTQIMGSGIYTLHSLSSRNQFESSYFENRKQYVTGTEGFGTELRFVAETPKGLIFSAGIQYQELHEKLSRQETETKRDVLNVTETVTEDRDGNIIGSTSGMQLVTTTTTYNQQLYNQYRFINFPFGIGYAFKNKKRRLKLIGGIDLNAYYKFSGSMFDRSQSIIELDSKSSSSYDRIYKNTVGIGIWASLEWHKPLNERLSLVIAPAIQTPIGSISQNSEEWPISHRVIKLKLGVGINYMLGYIRKPKKRSRKG